MTPDNLSDQKLHEEIGGVWACCQGDISRLNRLFFRERNLLHTERGRALFRAGDIILRRDTYGAVEQVPEIRALASTPEIVEWARQNHGQD